MSESSKVEKTSMLVELKASDDHSHNSDLVTLTNDIDVNGAEFDMDYLPIEMMPTDSDAGAESTWILRVILTEPNAEKELESHSRVLRLWKDTPIDSFKSDDDKPDVDGDDDMSFGF